MNKTKPKKTQNQMLQDTLNQRDNESRKLLEERKRKMIESTEDLELKRKIENLLLKN